MLHYVAADFVLVLAALDRTKLARFGLVLTLGRVCPSGKVQQVNVKGESVLIG